MHDLDPHLQPLRAAGQLGVLDASAVARVEAAFGPPTTLDVFGQPLVPGRALWGEVPPDGLAYIVRGSVREVILRRPREAGTESWRRGRDPEVVDVFGAGCFVGLSQLEDVFLSTVLEESAPADDEPFDETRVYYANPGRRIGEDPLVVRFLDTSALAELLQIPALRTWLRGRWLSCAMGRKARRFLRDDAVRSSLFAQQLASHPILRVLGRPALNALAQAAVAKRPLRPDGTAGAGSSDAFTEVVPEGGAWRLAGEPTADVQLLVEGQAELVLPGVSATERVVGLVRPGDLIDLQAVVAEHTTELRDLSVFLSDDAYVLTWPVDLVHDVLRSCPPAWHRLVRFVAPRVVDPAASEAQVTVIAEGGPNWGQPGDGHAFALGVAAWLATSSHVLLVDVQGQVDAMLDGLFGPLVEPDWPAGSSMDPETAHHPLPDHLVRTANSEGFLPERGAARLDIVVPADPRHLIDLVDALRGLASASHVVVYLPHGMTVDGPAAVRNHDEAVNDASAPYSLAMHVLDGLRILPYTVLWLSEDADGWYTLTDEAPERLIRADRLTERFVHSARGRAQAFMLEDGRLEDDDRPGNAVDGIMVVPMDAVSLLDQVREMPLQVAGMPRSTLGHACDRAYRMIHRQTVGVALGGGGTWGASHLAVLHALDQASVDVDYVSGTSFGAVVGGIFAGGGLPALRYFLERTRIAPQQSLVTEPVARAVSGLPVLGTIGRVLRRLRDERRALGNEVAGALRLGILGMPSAIDRLVERMVRDAPDAWARPADGSPSLRETHIPFFAVASNLTTHETFVPYHHTLGEAVRAAGSLPPGFPGFWFKGAKMVDGAALANVPVEVLRRGGADFVIAINVVGASPVPRDLQRMQPAVGTVFERVSDAVTTGWLTLWKAGTAEAERAADVLLDVRIQGVGLSETWRADDIVDALARELREERVVERIMDRYRSGRVPTWGPLRVSVLIDLAR